jgi:plastocyanin domain-containing protein
MITYLPGTNIMRLLSTAFYCSAILSSFAGYAAEQNTGKPVEVKITNKGFEPGSVKVGSDAPVTLKVTRETDQTCAKSIMVPKLNIKKDLPLNEPVLVEVGKLKKGQELAFACGMNMMTGVIVAQ